MTLRDDLRSAVLPLARLAGAVPLPALGAARFVRGWALPPEAMDYQYAFRLVPTIQFAVEMYQTTISSTPLKFYVGKGDNRKEIEREIGPRGLPNIAELWHNANPEDTGLDLIEQIVGSLQLQGNAFLFKDYDGAMFPKNLWVINPMEVDLVPAKNGRAVLGYRVGRLGAQIDVPKEQIIHFKRYDPNLGLTGLSRIASLSLMYETQRDAARFMRSFYRRGGSIAGHYSTEQAIDADAIESLKKDLTERSAGPENAWEPVILPQALKYERAGLTFAEMQFVETFKVTEKEILKIFRIHPILASEIVSAGLNSEVAQTAMMMFLRFGAVPESVRIARTLNEKLLASGEFGADVTCEFDYSNDPVMVKAKLDLMESWLKATGGAPATRAEARDSLGMPDRTNEFPELDEFLTPINMSTEGGAPPPPDPSLTPPKVPATEPKPPKKNAATERALEEMLGVRMTRDQLRRRNDRQLRIEERRFRAEAVRLFNRQRRRIIAKLQTQKSGERTVDLDALIATLDDPEDIRRARRLIRAIVQNRGDAVLADLALEIAFDMQRRAVVDFIQDHAADYVSKINETTRERLAVEIEDAINAGQNTIAEITAVIDAVFDGRRKNSETIARTETAPAWNFASLEGWEQSGVVAEKEWLTAHDDAVRDIHAAADGQVVPLALAFTVGEEALRFPGDPDGSAGNIINCRCTMVPRLSKVSGEEAMPKRIAERMNGNGKHDVSFEEWFDADLAGK